jgi:hypothetical protein
LINSCGPSGEKSTETSRETGSDSAAVVAAGGRGPVVAGALWLWWDVRSGLPGVLVGGLPGTLLLATGLSNLLWAGDARIFHFMSFGAI